MKKILMLASVASMISQFNMPNIKLLQELGYTVHVACNFCEGNTCDEKSIENLKKTLNQMQIAFYQIDFSRKINDIKRNTYAYRQILELLKINSYTFIHCHSPIGGAIGRLAAHKTKTRVIYTAHGFHFYKGAPLKNWLLYYPIEYYLAKYTDLIITINREDYEAAQKFRTKRVEYIPGVGIDLTVYNKDPNIRDKKRAELNIGNSTIVILSVGELNANKNHETVIKALAELQDVDFCYLICGRGALENYLKDTIHQFDLDDKVRLLGYREDVDELYQASDIFAFPSKREGLSVALMEAMANGLPVICNSIRGNTDLLENGKGGYLLENSNDLKEVQKKIRLLARNADLRKKAGIYNQEKIQNFALEKVTEQIKKLYVELERDTYVVEQ